MIDFPLEKNFKARSKRILIVDDTLDTRTILSSAFKKAGYRVYLAEDGIEGYLKFFKLKPDLVLTDILLPKMRGDIFVKWIKGTELGKSTPVIVVSGHTPMKDYLFQLGIEVFFDKPFKTAQIMDAAREILEIYEEKRSIEKRLSALKSRLLDNKPAAPAETRSKICEACQTVMSYTVVRCTTCGSLNVRMVTQ